MILKKKEFFLLIFIFFNIFYIAPCYSLSSRDDLFKNALDLSSGGKFNLALQEWNQYLDSFPDDAAGLSNRGNVRLVIGDVKGSIDDQNKAISLNPSEIDPYINRGIAEEALDLWSQAKRDYMFVNSQDSKNFSALYNLANVEGSISNWEKARDLFSKAALYNPGFAMARSSLALADFQLGNIDESEKELKNLIIKDKKLKNDLISKATYEFECSERNACDVELLMVGAFSPLEGFMDENNYKSVIKNNRDTSGLLFGLPIVFDSNNKEVKAGETILLTYKSQKIN